MTDSKRKDIEGEIRAVFGEGGLLSERLDSYECRPQQIEMATVVGRMLAAGERAVVEAGTGTGKTLAYLVPAVLSGKKILVSTATKTLQEQIFTKDVPLLRRLGFDVPVAYLKGRSNYLCLYRFEEFLRNPLFRTRAERAHFERILGWADQTETGDRAELSELPDDYKTWHDISTSADGCLGTKCPAYEECFVTRVRRRAAQAKVLIVNHHLFFADLAVRAGGFGEVLPDVDAVVFDEAHHLEETASSFFGRSVSLFRFRDLSGDIDRALSGVSNPPAQLALAVGSCNTDLGELFQLAKAQVPGGDRAELSRDLTERPEFREAVAGACRSLADLETALRTATALGESAQPLARRAAELKFDVEFILASADSRDSAWVYYSEVRGKRHHLFLHASPIDLGEYFLTLLYPKHACTLFTSATLAVGRRFDYFRSRIALGPEERVIERVLDPPFDHMEQALLYLPKGLPLPGAPDFVEQITPQVEALLHVTHGRAFVLFTSYRNMRLMHELLQDRVPYRLLMQGERSRSALLEDFRRKSSVLLATASFWEGVDVPGEKLSLVVVDKLPFASPGDPVVKARIKYINEQGGNAFAHYQLPQAALALKQGFGRLIRHRDDVGIVAILDRRLVDRHYGKVFLDTLPRARRTRRLETVERWWEHKKTAR